MLEYLAFYYYFLNGEENLRQGGNRRILKLRGTQFLFYQLEVTFLFWKRTSVLIPCQSEEMWCENSVHHHCASLSLSLSLCSKHLQTLCWKFILLSCTEETRTWKLVPVSMEANILTHFHLSEFKFSHLG